MDMTVEEITMKLIIETARIMHERGALPASHDSTWPERRAYIASMLRSEEGAQEIVNFLRSLDPEQEELPEEAEDEDIELIEETLEPEENSTKERVFVKYENKLSKMPADLRKYTLSYLKSLPKLIQYRIDAKEFKITDETSERIEADMQAATAAEIDRIKNFFNRTRETATILNYRVFEESFDKDPAKAAEVLAKVIGAPCAVSVTEHQILEPTDLREENQYMNHSIWIKTPIMPMIRVEIKKKMD